MAEAADGVSLGRLVRCDLGEVLIVRGALVQGAVRAMGVVVVDVVDEQRPELAFVPYEGAVE